MTGLVVQEPRAGLFPGDLLSSVIKVMSRRKLIKKSVWDVINFMTCFPVCFG